jgi:ribosomal protein L28
MVRCDVCDKKTAHGDSHIHRHSAWRYKAPRTKRTWVPNLRPVKIVAKGTVKEIKMCMSCYKRYTMDGVAFLKRKQVKELKGLTI